TTMALEGKLSMKVSEKIKISAAALIAVGLFASCGGGDAGADNSDTADAEPVKVAIIPPVSGALAEFGTGSRTGWEYAAKVANENGGVDGRPVELIFKDTDASANTTLQAVQEAVNQDGVNFIGGIMTSPEHGAVNQQLAGLDALSFNSTGKDDA